MEKLTFSPNTLIFDEGDPGDYTYMVVKGAVAIQRTRDDVPQALAVLKKGDIFGEMALLDDNPRMAAALAIEDTDVLAMSRDEFYGRLESVDPVLKSIITFMISRVRRMTDEFMKQKSEMAQQGLADIPQIASWFAEIIPPCHRRGNGTISAATR
jgi:CRP-like cAMP-binding protein